MGRISIITAAGGLVGLLLAGCAAPGHHPARPVGHLGSGSGPGAGPEAHPPGKQYASAGDVPAGKTGSMQPPAVPKGNLTLADALAASMLRNPELAAYAFDMRAAEARLLQARVLPNPELEFEVEECDRDGNGFDSAETAVVLTQTFELGGKRRWRKRAAQAEGDLAGCDYESKRLDVFAETARRFVHVLAAQERLELAASAVELAQKTNGAVSERVKAGKEPPLQASKSEAELEMARLDALAAQNTLAVARKKLAAMWGAETAAFDTAEGSLDHVPNAAASLEELRSRLEFNPDLARWDTELRLRRAALASQKAARVPDLKASLGFLQYEEDGTDAFAFGVGAPLPLFDWNHGNIMAARHELAAAESERSAAAVELAAALAEAQASLTNAHQRVRTLRTKVVPAMEQAYEAAHEGYRQGKFDFLDMLDAQRGLFEAQTSLVDALNEYQAALIDIQRITATGIGDLNCEKKEN